MTKSEKLICLGHISGAHGIRGEVLIKSYTEPWENIASYGTLSDEAQSQQYEITAFHTTNKGVVARLSGVGDRNAAEALKGVALYIERDCLPDDEEEDSWYHVDLIGLAAFENGQAIGDVIAVPNFGAGDLLEIKLFDTGKTILLPFTKACVPSVNISNGEVHVSRPEEWDGEDRSS